MKINKDKRNQIAFFFYSNNKIFSFLLKKKEIFIEK